MKSSKVGDKISKGQLPEPAIAPIVQEAIDRGRKTSSEKTIMSPVKQETSINGDVSIDYSPLSINGDASIDYSPLSINGDVSIDYSPLSINERIFSNTNKLVSRHVHIWHINNEFDNQKSEEAKVASWLLPTPNNAKGVDLEGSEYKSADYLFNDMNPYLDMTMISGGGDQNLETSPPPPSTLQFKRHHTGGRLDLVDRVHACSTQGGHLNQGHPEAHLPPRPPRIPKPPLIEATPRPSLSPRSPKSHLLPRLPLTKATPKPPLPEAVLGQGHPGLGALLARVALRFSPD
nr:zinc finger protein CONSTANS-LIKE 4-like [Ipomoea trifida]